MSRNFSELEAKMAPERRAKSSRRTKELLARMRVPTPAQWLVYDAILAHISEHGSAPTFQQIADRMGKALATVYVHVRGLAQRKLLELTDKGKICAVKATRCPTCGHRKPEFGRSMKQSIRKGLATPVSECRTELEWK